MGLLDGKIGANAALDFGGNILTMGLNHYWQKKQLAQNEQWAREDATSAYNRQIEQWNRENAYNTPKAQMQRALEAGLNPNLYLAQQGLGNGSIGTPTVPQAASAGGDAYTSPTGLTSFVDAEYKQAMIDNLNSQTKQIDELTPYQVKQLAAQLNVSEEDAQRLHQETINLKKQFEKIGAEIKVLSEAERAKRIENSFNQETFDSRVGMIEKEFEMSRVKSEKFARMLESSIAQAFGNAKQANAAAERTKQMTSAEVRLTNVMAAYYQNLANKTLSEQNLLDVEKSLKEVYGEDEIVSKIMNNLTSGEFGTITNILGTDINNRVIDKYHKKKS